MKEVRTESMFRATCTVLSYLVHHMVSRNA